MAKTKLALFDLDGTLAETSEANVEAYRRAFADQSLAFNQQVYQGSHGMHWTQSLPLLHPEGTLEEFNTLRSAKSRHYAQLMALTKPIKPVIDLYNLYEPTHYRAVVTSASRANAETILKHLGLTPDLLIAADDVQRPKPDPEGFLKAMAHFGIGPEDTIIYEDSERGLQAARASGATVVNVATLLT
ncbi:MAG TPA: HAD family phosphatase [Alphaproteobacteria bacterium]|nr:HAD family phosphatase [Alphaproteobacteria bacterium]